MLSLTLSRFGIVGSVLISAGGAWNRSPTTLGRSLHFVQAIPSRDAQALREN
jgi:hypothetical protein